MNKDFKIVKDRFKCSFCYKDSEVMFCGTECRHQFYGALYGDAATLVMREDDGSSVVTNIKKGVKVVVDNLVDKSVDNFIGEVVTPPSPPTPHPSL